MSVPVPVQISLTPGQAEQYDLEITGPAQIAASFTGPPSRMRELRSMLQKGGLRVGVMLTVPTDRQQESQPSRHREHPRNRDSRQQRHGEAADCDRHRSDGDRGGDGECETQAHERNTDARRTATREGADLFPPLRRGG